MPTITAITTVTAAAAAEQSRDNINRRRSLSHNRQDETVVGSYSVPINKKTLKNNDRLYFIKKNIIFALIHVKCHETISKALLINYSSQ